MQGIELQWMVVQIDGTYQCREEHGGEMLMGDQPSLVEGELSLFAR